MIRDWAFRNRGVLSNALLMQLLWFAAVLGAAYYGFGAVAVIPLLGIFVFGHYSQGSFTADCRMALLTLLIAIPFELILIALKVVNYADSFSAAWPPIWILLLWAGLGASCNYSLAWLRQRLWLAALLGGIGSASSMRAGVALGAATAPHGIVTLLVVYMAAWACIMPLLIWLSRGRQHDRCTLA